MLGMPLLIIFTHMLTVALFAVGFSGVSVGLGAIMPNFRESDPSKIAVGFGGTVNLIIGLILLGAIIVTVAGPMQFVHGRDPEVGVSLSDVPWFVWAGMLVGTCIGLFAAWYPMRAGMRNLRALEF